MKHDLCPTCGQPWPFEPEDEPRRDDLEWRLSPKEKARLADVDRDDSVVPDDDLLDDREALDEGFEGARRDRYPAAGGCLLVSTLVAASFVATAAALRAALSRGRC